MSHLAFSFKEFLDEIQAIKEIAKPFICLNSLEHGLPRLATVLEEHSFAAL